MPISFYSKKIDSNRNNSVPILILIRHGECLKTDCSLFGQTDIPLDPNSISLLSDTGKHLASFLSLILKKNVLIKSYLTSDLKRCQDTALILKKIFDKELGINIYPTFTPNLREMHIGDWENAKIDEIIEEVIPFINCYQKNPDHAKPPGEKAESAGMVRKRVTPLIEKYLNMKKNNSISFQSLLLDLENLNTFEEWIKEITKSLINLDINFWFVHEGSAHAILKVLDIDCWEPDMEAELVYDVHQTFFNRGDVMILRPHFFLNNEKERVSPILKAQWKIVIAMQR